MTAPAKPSALSTVYFDKQRIGLMGDPRPAVAKVVAAAGHSPEAVQVVRSRSPDSAGTPVRLDDVVDRTADPTKAIYLSAKPKVAPGVGAAESAPPRSIAIPVSLTAPELRGPLPAQPSPVPPRSAPTPGGTDGPVEPEWGI